MRIGPCLCRNHAYNVCTLPLRRKNVLHKQVCLHKLAVSMHAEGLGAQEHSW